MTHSQEDRKEWRMEEMQQDYMDLGLVFNTGLAIARPVFWKPGCDGVCKTF